MFEGLKFIPRDQIDKDSSSDDLKKGRKNSKRWEEKHKSKKKSTSRYSSSDEELGKVKRGSKKKWYSSEEYSSSSSGDERRRRSKKKGKRRNNDESEDESSESDDSAAHNRRGKHRGSKKGRKNAKKKSGGGGASEQDTSDGSAENNALKEKDIVRKEMGLEWMLRPGAKREEKPAEIEMEDTKNEEVPKVNPRELNPYLKDNGSGYPEEKDGTSSNHLSSSTVIGDGGASWRLKAMKRAKEQAARDGRKFEEVVEERWGNVGQLAVSVSSHRAAPARAHLHAINSRKRGSAEETQSGSGSQRNKETEKNTGRDYLKDISVRVPKMKEPKAQDSLSWGPKRRSQHVDEQSRLVSDAVSSINKFSNDGNFMREVLKKQNDNSRGPVMENAKSEPEPLLPGYENLSANQLAAKALQLRLKGKPEEAEKLMQQVEYMRAKEAKVDDHIKPQRGESSSRHVTRELSHRRKKNEDDGDMHLAQKIAQNKKFTISGQADDEYDFDGSPSKKSRKKRGSNHHDGERNIAANRFSTKQEECIFCFESQKRPTHLVVAVANFTYLMLPQREAVVPGHCCILPMQHVPASRNVDDYVWEEIRNFKKCLIMMFGKQEKDVVFLETAVGLAKQRRHCMIECIPLPREIAEEAPHYFKMEIEEAESEWSQHNAKKLIRTDVKGLRGSIPENIPYFHVEFGLKSGFLHPIDDEREFAGNFGLNVIRGIMKLPEEDMYRRRRHASTEEQKQGVQTFAQDWAQFDWTKQLREES